MPKKLVINKWARFGRLVVIEEVLSRKNMRRFFMQCDCGKQKTVLLRNMLNGKRVTSSCGCLAKENVWNRRRTHNMRKTREYETWHSMKSRCYREKNASYLQYGGRGIKVCGRWINSFENFYADMWDKPTGYSLDRIDVNGNYEPSNCKWSTCREQCNNRRGNRWIEFNWMKKTLSQWSREVWISFYAIRSRLDRWGLSVSEALTRPSRRKKITK